MSCTVRFKLFSKFITWLILHAKEFHIKYLVQVWVYDLPIKLYARPIRYEFGHSRVLCKWCRIMSVLCYVWTDVQYCSKKGVKSLNASPSIYICIYVSVSVYVGCERSFVIIETVLFKSSNITHIICIFKKQQTMQ